MDFSTPTGSQKSCPDETDDVLSLEHNPKEVGNQANSIINEAIEWMLLHSRIASKTVDSSNPDSEVLPEQGTEDGGKNGAVGGVSVDNVRTFPEPVRMAHSLQSEVTFSAFEAATSEEIGLGNDVVEISISTPEEFESEVCYNSLGNIHDEFSVDQESDTGVSEEPIEVLKKHDYLEPLEELSFQELSIYDKSNNNRNYSTSSSDLYSSLNDSGQSDTLETSSSMAIITPPLDGDTEIQVTMVNSDPEPKKEVIICNSENDEPSGNSINSSLKMFYESEAKNLISGDNESGINSEMPVLEKATEVAPALVCHENPPVLIPETKIVPVLPEPVVGVVHPFNRRKSNDDIDSKESLGLKSNISISDIDDEPVQQINTRDRLQARRISIMNNSRKHDGKTYTRVFVPFNNSESKRKTKLISGTVKNLSVHITKSKTCVNNPYPANVNVRQGISSGNLFRVIPNNLQRNSFCEDKPLAYENVKESINFESRLPLITQNYSQKVIENKLLFTHNSKSEIGENSKSTVSCTPSVGFESNDKRTNQFKIKENNLSLQDNICETYVELSGETSERNLHASNGSVQNNHKTALQSMTSLNSFPSNIVRQGISSGNVFRLIPNNLKRSSFYEDEHISYESIKEPTNFKSSLPLITQNYSQKVIENKLLFTHNSKSEMGENSKSTVSCTPSVGFEKQDKSLKQFDLEVKENNNSVLRNSIPETFVEVAPETSEKKTILRAGHSSEKSALPSMPSLLSPERESSPCRYTIKAETMNTSKKGTDQVTRRVKNGKPQRTKVFTRSFQRLDLSRELPCLSQKKPVTTSKTIVEKIEKGSSRRNENGTNIKKLDVSSTKTPITGKTEHRPDLETYIASHAACLYKEKDESISPEIILGKSNDSFKSGNGKVNSQVTVNVLEKDLDVSYSNFFSLSDPLSSVLETEVMTESSYESEVMTESSLETEVMTESSLETEIISESSSDDYLDCNEELMDKNHSVYNEEVQSSTLTFHCTDEISSSDVSKIEFPLPITSVTIQSETCSQEYDSSENLCSQIDKIDEILYKELSNSVNFDDIEYKTDPFTSPSKVYEDATHCARYPLELSEHGYAAPKCSHTRLDILKDPPNEEVSSADKDDTCACLPTETLTPRPVGSPSSELLELCNGEVSETVTNSVKARTSTSSNSHEDCDLNNRNLESINGFVKDISTETVPLHTKGTVQVPHTINTVSTSEVSENVSKTSVVPTALGMDTPNKSTLSESSTQSQCSLNVSNTLAKPLCSDLDLSLPSVSDIVPDLIDSADDRTHSENLSVSFTPDNSFFKPSAVPSQEIHCQVASPSSGLSYSTSKDIATPIRSDTTDLSESISTSDLVLPDFKLPESYDASHSVTSLTTNISTSVDTSESTFSSSNPINKEHNATKHVSDFVGNKSESSQCGTTTSLVDKTEIALKSPKELNHECSKHISKEDNSTICARNEPFSELNNSNKPSTSNQKNIIFGGNVAKFPKEKNVAGTSNKESLTGSIEKLVINRDITSKDSNKNLQKSVSINSTSNACNNKLKRNTKFSKSRINEITNRLHEAHKSLNMLDAKTEKFSSVRQVLDNTLTDKNKTNNLPIISKDSPVKAMNQLDKRALHLARENESTHTINAAENGKNTDSYLPVDDKEQSSVSFSSTNKENHVGLPPVDDVAKRKERGPSPSCSIGESEKKRSSKNMNELDKEALFQPLKLVKTDIPISEEENVEPVTVFVILKNAGKVSESMIERITKRIANANGRLLQKPNKPSKLPLVIENMTYSNEDKKTKNASDDTSVNIVAGSKKSENSSLKNCNSKSNSLKSHVCSNKLLHGAIVSDAVVEKCEVTPPGLNGICKNSSSQNIPIGDQAIPSTSMTKEINEPKRTASSIQSELLLEEVGRTKTKTIKMLKHSTKRKTLLSQKKPQVTVVHKAILAKKSKIQNKVQENDKKMTISNEIEGVEEILKPQVQCNEVQLNCSAFDEVCELEGRPSVGLVIQANVNESTLPVNNYIQTNKRHSKKHNSSSKEQPNTSVEKTSKKINSDCIEEHSQRLRGDIEVKGIEIDILPDETNASKGLSTSTIVKQFAITSEEAAVNATQESKLDIRPAKPSGKFNSMKEKLTPADKGKPIEIAQNSVTSETKKTSGYVEKRKLKTKSNKLRTSSKNNDIPVSGKGISTVAKRKPLAKCTVALKRKSICDVSKNEMSFGDVNGRNNILVNEVKKHDEQSSFEEDTKLNQMQSIDLSSKESVSIIEEQHGGLKQIQLAGETPQSSQVEDQNLNKQSSIVDFGKFKEIKDTKNCSINETTISNKSILDHHDDLKEQFSSEIIVMQTENLNIQHSLREEVATEKQEEAVSELELFVEGSKTSELLHENSQKEFSSDQQKKSLTEQSPVQESNKSNQLKDEDLFKQCTVVEVEKGKTTEQEEPKDHCSFGESNESILVRNEGLEQVITVECAEITGQQKDDLQNKSFSDEADDTQHDFHERFSIENVVGINEEQNGNFQEDCSTSVVVETNEEKLKNPKEDFLAMETIGTNDEQNKNLHRVRSAVQADKNKSVNLQVQCSIDAASRTKDQNLESLGKELSVVDAIQTKDGKHDNLQEECTVEANETNKELQEDLAKQYAALEVIGVNKEQHEHLQQECINEESSLKTADQQEKFLKICSGEEPAKEGQLGNLPIECSSAETYKQQHEDVQKECSADKVIETKEQQLGYSQNEFYSEESIRTVEESHGNLQKEGSLVAVNEKNEEQCKDFPKQYFAVESVVEIKELQDHLQKGYFPVEVINDNDDHQQSQQNNFFSKKCMGTNEEQDFVRSAVQADENESANLQVQCSIDAASGTEAQNLESLGKELSVVDAIQTKDGKHDNLQKENSASKANETNEERQEYLIKEDAAVETNEGKIDKSKIESSPDEIINQKHENIQQECITANCTKDQELEISLNKCFTKEYIETIEPHSDKLHKKGLSIQQITSLDEKQQNLRKEYFNEELIVTNEEEQYEDSQKICPAEESIETNENKLNYLQIEYSTNEANEQQFGNAQKECSSKTDDIGAKVEQFDNLEKGCSSEESIETKEGHHENLQKECSSVNEILEESVQKERFPLDEFGTIEEKNENLIKECLTVEAKEGQHENVPKECSTDHNSLQEEGSSAETIETNENQLELVQKECSTDKVMRATEQQLQNTKYECSREKSIGTIEEHHDSLQEEGSTAETIEEHHDSLQEEEGASAETNENQLEHVQNECSTDKIITETEQQLQNKKNECSREESIGAFEEHHDSLQEEGSSVETIETNENQLEQAQKERSTDKIITETEQELDKTKNECSREESIEAFEEHHDSLQEEGSSVETIETNENQLEQAQKERSTDKIITETEQKLQNKKNECSREESIGAFEEHHDSLQEEGSSVETIETNENQLEQAKKERSTDKIITETEQKLQKTKNESSRVESIGTIEEHHDCLQEGSSAETIEANENQLEHVQKECSTDKIITETEQQLQNKKNECSREESIEAFEEHHDSLQEEGSSVETIETNENQLEQAQKERSTDKIITETEQKLQKTKNECSRVESIGTIEEHHDCLQEGSSAETIEANENQLEHAQKECSTDKIIRKTVQQLESTKNKCFTEESIGSNEEHHDSLQEKRSSAETIETKKSELEQVQKECSTDEIITETEQDLEKTKNERSREESIGTIEEHHGTLQEEASSVDTNDNQLEHVQKGCCTDKGNMTSEVQQEDLENKFLKELTINANEEKFKIAQKECFTADSLQIGEQQLENSLKDYCKETILINEEQQEDLLRECSREESLKMNDDHHDNLQKERTSKKVDETNEEQQLGNLEKDCSIELSIRNIEYGENFRVECSTIEAIEDKQNDLLKECSTADTIESKEQQHQNLQIKCSALEALEGNEELSATNEKRHESFQERCLSEQQKHENFKNIGALEMKNEEIHKHSVKGCLTEETIETKEDQLKNMQKECPTVEAIEGNEGKVKNSQKECSSVEVIKKKVDQYENLEKGFHMVEINVEDKQENLKKECSTLAAPDEKQLGDLHKTFPSAVVTVVINEVQRLNLQKGIFTNMAVRTNEEQCENLQKEFSSVDIIHSTLEANETNQEQYKNLQEEGPSLGVICKDEEKHKNLIEKCSIFVTEEEKHLNLPTECSTENTVETKEQQDTNLQKECFPEDLKKQCRSNDIEKPVHFQSEILEAIHVEHVPLNKQHFTDKAAETPVQHTRRYEPVCSPISSVECSEKESSPEGDNQKLYVNKIENNCIPVSFIETPTEESCQDVEDDNLDKYSPRSYKSKYFWKPKSRNPSKLIGAITENDSSNEKCPSNSTKDQDASEEPISTNSNTGDKLSTKGALNQNMSCITNPVPLRELETIKTIDYSQNLLQEYSNENSGKCKERHILGKDKPFKRTRSTSKDKQEPASKVHVASILNKENNSSSVIEKEPKGQLRVNSSLKENSAHLTRKNKVYYKELKPSCEQVREEVVCRSNIQKQDKQVSSFSSEDVKDASREKRNTRKNIKEDSRTTEKLRKVISSETCNLHPSNSTGDSKKTEDNFISSFKRSSAQKVKKQEHEGGKPEPPLRTSHDHLKCEVKINRIASKFYLRKLMKDFGVRIVYLPPPVYDSVIPSGESDDECNYKIIRYGVRNRRVDKKIKEEPILHKFDSKNEENILQYQKEERRKRLRRKQNSKSSNQKSSLNQTLDSPDINNSTPVSGAFSGRVPVPVDSGDISLTARHVLGSQGVRYNMPNHNSCSRDLKVAIPMSPTDLCVSPGIISSPDTISDRVPIHVKVGSNYNDSTVCSTRPSENVRYNIPINNRNCTSRNVTVPLNQTNCHDSSASIIPAPETVAERIPVPSSCESSSRNFKMPLPNTSHTVLTNCKTSVRDKLSLHEPLSKLLGQQYNCYSQNSSRKRPNEEEDIGACKRPNLSSSSCSRNMISPESLCSDQNVTGNANKPSTPSLALSRLLSCTKEELNELSSLIEKIKKSGCDPLPSTSGLSSHCPSTSQNLPSFDYNLDLTVKKDPVSLEDIHKLLQKRSVARKKDEADFLGFEPIPHDSCSCKPDCFSECCSCSYFYRCQENLKRLNSVVEKYCTLGQGSLLENQSSHIFRSSSSTSVKNSSVISNKIHSTRALDAQLTNETFSNDVFHLESSDKKPSKKMKLTCFSTIPRRLETHLSQSNSNDSPLLVYPANDDEGLNTPGPSRPRQCKALTPGFYSVASPKSDEDDSDS